MRYDLLIRGGKLVTSSRIDMGDVGISGGRIEAIGELAGASAEEEIDARNLLVLPGLIDTQVHFREPGFEHKEDLESGTRSAIYGGVTSILEMPNTSPPTVSEEALEDKLQRAVGRAWCNFGFFVGATHENVDDLDRLERRPGTPGVKVFMGSSTGSLLIADDETLSQVLRAGTKRVALHAEDEARNRERRALYGSHPSVVRHPDIRDAESARLATSRLLRACEQTGRPVHILHISTADELPLIREAKRAGLPVTAEVTPQHLWFSAPECYERLGTRAQMNPPIRSLEHTEALRLALNEGLFDVFGSDHAPHTLEEKARPYPESPSGMPGVQTTLPVLSTMGVGWTDLVRMACENPARLYGIRGKGFLKEGYDADFVLVDPDWERVVESSMIQSKCGWSPYDGERLIGWPRAAILGGKIVVRENESTGSPSGRVLEFSNR